jgi:hypothetical protein
MMQPIKAMSMKPVFLHAELNNGHIRGCVVEGYGYEPSGKCALVYLHGGEDLNEPPERVEVARQQGETTKIWR